MRIILKNKKGYVIRFDYAEDIIRGLKKFCMQNKISAGYFFGIGAAQKVTLSFYNLAKKKYQDKTIKKDLEIVSLAGNIAKLDNDLMIHAHAVLADSKMQTIGGHVKELEISATCEICLIPFAKKIVRKLDEKTGLNLMCGLKNKA
jgi:hypothetical protein